jgi:hypothetical protein
LFTLVELWRFAKAGLLCAVWLLSISPAHSLAMPGGDGTGLLTRIDSPMTFPVAGSASAITREAPSPASTYVKGICQRRPEPLVTGSDWSHPTYDSNFEAACACREGKMFDWSVEWCTGAPSCRTYPDNKVTECGRTVDELVNFKKDRSDPTRYFHETQACIARSTCNLRCKMEHCDWLKEVIPAFVDPCLRKSGEWPAIEDKCRKRFQTWINARRCANEMAREHIFYDLLPALVRYGCGSESDWGGSIQRNYYLLAEDI